MSNARPIGPYAKSYWSDNIIKQSAETGVTWSWQSLRERATKFILPKFEWFQMYLEYSVIECMYELHQHAITKIASVCHSSTQTILDQIQNRHISTTITLKHPLITESITKAERSCEVLSEDDSGSSVQEKSLLKSYLCSGDKTEVKLADSTITEKRGFQCTF